MGGASALEHALDNLTENRLGHELPHCILHIRIRGEAEPGLAPPSSLAFYHHGTTLTRRFHVRIVSVVKEMWARTQGQRRARLRDLLASTVGKPRLSVVRGQLLEHASMDYNAASASACKLVTKCLALVGQPEHMHRVLVNVNVWVLQLRIPCACIELSLRARFTWPWRNHVTRTLRTWYHRHAYVTCTAAA